MDRLLDERTVQFLKRKFSNLKNEVKIKFYKGGNCEYCPEIEQMIKEVSETNEKISYEVIPTDKGPYITFEGYENVQYWGIPAMQEFRAFIDTIEAIGKGVSLPLPIAKEISKIKDPIEILIFVTPQCPYCPLAVFSANKFAIFNKNIKSVTVEAVEFPEWADKYSVMAVPKIVIRKDNIILDEWEGAMPDPYFAQRIAEAYEKGE